MHSDDIRRRLKGGFRPFTIHLSDGRTYLVPHPELTLVAKQSVAVVDKAGFIDRMDPLHIVSIKDTSAKKP